MKCFLKKSENKKRKKGNKVRNEVENSQMNNFLIIV